jgi:Fe-S oxidoreductase
MNEAFMPPPTHTIPDPAIDYAILGLTGAVAQTLLLVLAGGAFLFILRQRFALLKVAASDPRGGDWAGRLRRLFVIGFGQSRQPRYRVAGVVHIVIFAGFLVLSVRSLSLMIEPFAPGAADLGTGYEAFKDWTGLLVLVACAVAAWRRVVVRPARYADRQLATSHSPEALRILALISLLMLADALVDGSALLLHGQAGSWFTPMASAAAAVIPTTQTIQLPGAANALAPASVATVSTVHLIAFWVHNTALLIFLCLLPLGKHFHVLTALPNVFLSKLGPGGQIKPPSHEQADFDALDHVGVSKLEDFSWKHLLDAYTCTDCGRCSDHCPAYAAGTPLSPRMISIKMRDAAYQAYPIWGKVVPPEKRPALVGETISEGELWSCTTCGACEEACPVMIEYVDKVVDMRRFLVDDGRLPATLQKPMAALEKRGNPYGKMARKRGDWVAALSNPTDVANYSLRVLGKGEACDNLYFTDSCAAFDPRVQQTAVAFGDILCRAGIDVGILGKDEVDSGHEARRFGEEGLFLALREQNLEALEQRSFQRIITSDPHALNALRHDYELKQPVVHHSQVLAELLAAGKLPLQPLNDQRRYTFHDPCYLGRHNGEYNAPRQVMQAIPGIQTVEMERSRNRSFCCGGGSLNLFHESECERRMGEIRLDMAAEAEAQVIVTACPFCLVNLEDAIKTSGRDEQMEVVDLAELVQRSLALISVPAAETTTGSTPDSKAQSTPN